MLARRRTGWHTWERSHRHLPALPTCALACRGGEAQVATWSAGRGIASSGSRSPRQAVYCPQDQLLLPLLLLLQGADAGSRAQVGRGQKLGEGPGTVEFGEMTVEGLLQVGRRQEPQACAAQLA